MAQVAFPERVDWQHSKLTALMTRAVWVEKPEWYSQIHENIVHFVVKDLESVGDIAKLVNAAQPIPEKLLQN